MRVGVQRGGFRRPYYRRTGGNMRIPWAKFPDNWPHADSPLWPDGQPKELAVYDVDGLSREKAERGAENYDWGYGLGGAPACSCSKCGLVMLHSCVHVHGATVDVPFVVKPHPCWAHASEGDPCRWRKTAAIIENGVWEVVWCRTCHNSALRHYTSGIVYPLELVWDEEKYEARIIFPSE